MNHFSTGCSETRPGFGSAGVGTTGHGDLRQREGACRDPVKEREAGEPGGLGACVPLTTMGL